MPLSCLYSADHLALAAGGADVQADDFRAVERLLGVLQADGFVVGRIFVEDEFERFHAFLGGQPGVSGAGEDDALIVGGKLGWDDSRPSDDGECHEWLVCQAGELPPLRCTVDVQRVEGFVPHVIDGDAVSLAFRCDHRQHSIFSFSDQFVCQVLVEQPVLPTHLFVGVILHCLSFFVEVESYVELQDAIGIVYPETFAVVVVRVRQEGCPDVVLRVVVDDGGTRDDVEVDVVVGLVVRPVLKADVGRLVPDGRRHGEVRQAVLGEDPVVAVAEVQAVVDVAYLAEAHVVLQLSADALGQLSGVEEELVAGVGKACNERAGTFALVGRLAVGGRVGEASVVEDVVEIDALHLRLQSVETESLPAVYVVESRDILHLEVVAALQVVDVGSQLGAVEAEVEFAFLAPVAVLAEEVVHVDGPPEENPAPPEVCADAPRRGGDKGEALFLLRGAGDAVVLVRAGRVEHEGEVVEVRGDVARVGIVEIYPLHHAREPGLAFLLADDGIGRQAVSRRVRTDWQRTCEGRSPLRMQEQAGRQ